MIQALRGKTPEQSWILVMDAQDLGFITACIETAVPKLKTAVPNDPFIAIGEQFMAEVTDVLNTSST